VSPVMARCRHSWPIAECTKPECAPWVLFAPATPPRDADSFGAVLEEAPPIVATIAITGATVAAVVVIGGITVTAWAVGVVIDALRGRP
jgi:hypothetical protein